MVERLLLFSVYSSENNPELSSLLRRVSLVCAFSAVLAAVVAAVGSFLFSLSEFAARLIPS